MLEHRLEMLWGKMAVLLGDLCGVAMVWFGLVWFDGLDLDLDWDVGIDTCEGMVDVDLPDISW